MVPVRSDIRHAGNRRADLAVWLHHTHAAVAHGHQKMPLWQKSQCPRILQPARHDLRPHGLRQRRSRVAYARKDRRY